MKIWLAFLITAATFFVAHPARAHPHIFVKYEAEITKKDASSYNVHFTFNVHVVTNSNPLFKDVQGQLGNLREAIGQHPFYVYPDINGRPLGQQTVELSPAGGTESEPVFSYDMEVPAGQNFGFSIYDPEYFDAVSLAGAGALKVSDKSLICNISHIEVGKTMWGINSTSHIECGDGSKPFQQFKPLKKLPFDQPDMGVKSFNDQIIP